MACWFGEQHPGTGQPEQWVVEECETTEHFCYQMVVHGGGEEDRGFESRQCWDLKYEVWYKDYSDRLTKKTLRN